MIYITGDTHGLKDIGKLFSFNLVNRLSEKDFMIIAGDFGVIWDANSIKNYIDIYNHFPFTTLFIDGNHENFDYLDTFPIEQWNGGKIHRISNKIIHLIRGEVFSIDEKKILAIGGAESDDKDYRTNYLSWWRQETITRYDIERAIETSSQHNRIDCVITHTCPKIFLTKELLNSRQMKIDYTSEEMLNIIAEKINFTKWYFGHWHIDSIIKKNVRCLYQDIVELL